MYKKYFIKPEEGLTEVKLAKILQEFQTRDLPKLNKYWNYYIGKQKILNKEVTDVGKPCNKIVCNYCSTIVDNYLGYITGKPIAYENKGFEEIVDILKYNDYQNEDSELLRQALIFGRAFEINYIDEEGKQRFKNLETRQCVPVYEDTIEEKLRYVIRFWKEELVDDLLESYFIEVYDDTKMVKYKSTPGFSGFTLIEEIAHFYKDVPITVFSLNTDEESIYSQIIRLQDAYNQLLSDEVDDFDSFCDAYLLLKGVTADTDDLQSMRKNRVLMMDADCDASYLTKSVSDTQIENMLTNVNDQIYKIANSPDFTDEKFMTQSGVAIQYKLVGFENKASAIESNMRKALQRRIELISNIISLTDADTVWRDVEITFTRNLPFNLEGIVQVVNSLRGIVSDRTLLTLLPFISDIDEELAQVKAEKQENMDLYQNNSFNDSEEEIDE